MSFFTPRLLAAYFGILLFCSCNKSDLIGLDIDNTDSLASNHIVDYNIPTLTVRDDSVLTSRMDQYPLAVLRDPVFGLTEAGMAMSFQLPGTGFSFGTEPQLDSAILVLKYGREFYGDSLYTNFAVGVHELQERLKAGVNYYSNKSWNYASQPIVSNTVNHFKWRDSIYVNQVVKDKKDTLVKVSPELRIRMDDFAAKRLLVAGSADLINQEAFEKYMKGFYLKLSTKQPDNVGGVAFFNLSGDSRLEVHYKNKNTTTSKLDTNVSAFKVYAAAAGIKHAYNGTPIQEQLDNPGVSYPTVYAQPMGGLRVKLQMPDISKLTAMGNVAVHRSELVVNVLDSDAPGFKPAPYMALYYTDIAGQKVASAYYIPAAYDKVNKRYVFEITSYLQPLVMGKTKMYDVFIAPLTISNRQTNQGNMRINESPTATTAARAILGGKDSGEYKIKLNVIYSKP